MKLADRKMRIFVRKNKSGKFSKTPKMDKLVLKDTHNPKLNILECDSTTHELCVPYYIVFICTPNLSLVHLLSCAAQVCV